MGKVMNVKVEGLKNPLGLTACPLITWTDFGLIKQTAFEILFQTDHNKSFESGIILSEEMHYLVDFPLESRERVQFKIRVYDENQKEGEWSEAYFFEMGLNSKEEYSGKWILPEKEDMNRSDHQPASVLRSTFYYDHSVKKARIFLSSKGVYEAFLNGKRIGDFILAPGSVDYNFRQPVQMYDVTDLLIQGKNEFVSYLGDGWYRSVSGVDGVRNVYGSKISLYVQLEIDEQMVLLSGRDLFEASNEGPIRFNDLQQGEVYDANMEDIKNFHPVREKEIQKELMTSIPCMKVTEHEHFKGTLFQTPNGQTVIDFNQNLAGYPLFSVNAKGGETIRLLMGETLDEKGNFTQENFQDRKRHKEGGTRQELIYTCKPGINTYKPHFTVFGFRYARIETDLDLTEASFEAVAIYSDMDELTSFSCGNEMVTKLFSNALWSMKSNFLDVPTDCPTRERAAWTGDMGVFVETGITLMDCYPVIRKWLYDCKVSQRSDGKVANIAPKNKEASFFSSLLSGSVGWGDAVIKVPYACYIRTGDKRILEENYEMMVCWYTYLKSRASKTKISVKNIFNQNVLKKYVIDTGIDYGEWCEPDTDNKSQMGKTNSVIATAYFQHTAQMLSKIATILGKNDDAHEMTDTAERTKEAYQKLILEDGRMQSDRQADYVRALQFNLFPTETKAEMAQKLNELVIKNDYHLNTGFLGTPMLLFALSENGYTETAYRLLLQDTCPSWLYEVKKGATTIWETWDGISEDGVPRESLNHYSYGAVLEWMIKCMAGIWVKHGQIRLNPLPYKAIGSAECSYLSPFGLIKSGWSYTDNGILYRGEIPANTTAEFVFPDGETKKLLPGYYEFYK